MNLDIIYREDCVKGMKKLPDESIDLIFTDPPYNENYKYRDSHFIDYRSDYYTFIDRVLRECKRILKPTGSIYLKHSSRQIGKIISILNKYFIFRNLIIWTSQSQSHPENNYDSSYEPLYFYSKTDNYIFHKRIQMRSKPYKYWSGKKIAFIGLMNNIWNIKKENTGCIRSKNEKEKSKDFPCSMPVGLPYRAIIFSSNENNIVLDPFIGSGTTAIACIKSKRHYIGYEIDESYYNLAKSKIDKEKNIQILV